MKLMIYYHAEFQLNRINSFLLTVTEQETYRPTRFSAANPKTKYVI